MPGATDKRSDELKLLELVGDICGLLDIDELRHGLLDALQRVLPSDYISINDIGPGPDDIVAVMHPPGTEEQLAGWRVHAHENPLLRYFQSSQNGRSRRFSDVITTEQLHRMPLYREVYAPMGVEHQLAFTLPAGSDRVLAIALSRGEADYSDAECLLADRARPYLIQAYLNAIAFQAQQERHGEAAPAAELAQALHAHGLTPREADAVRMLALGRSNHHIAAELGISHRTVGKHLERSFRKLGVSDRSSAAGRAWELAATPPGDGAG